MRTKLQIKSIFGSVLFELEKENNTIKGVVIEAVKNKAYLQGAYLRGADLQGADLRGAYLQGADLRGAYLQGADLQGANSEKITLKKAIVITGLYKYIVIAFISEDNEKWVKLGCFTRELSEWKKDFWNNKNEFPNNNSEKSNLRLLAFETAKKWFELIEKSE